MTQFPNPSEGQGRNPVSKRVLQLAGIDDPQVFEPQVVDDDVHRFRGFRGIRALELEPEPLPAAEQQKVQFGASLGSVEVGLVPPVGDECLLEGESLPTGAVARVEGELIRVFKPPAGSAGRRCRAGTPLAT